MMEREIMRCCVVTRSLFPRRSLLRVVRTPTREVYWDPTQKAPGRGAYLLPQRACIEQARKRRALERALRGPVPVAVYDTLCAQVVDEDSLHAR